MSAVIALCAAQRFLIKGGGTFDCRASGKFTVDKSVLRIVRVVPPKNSF